MWADPAPNEAEPCNFLPNPPRGDGNVVCYSLIEKIFKITHLFQCFGQSSLERFFQATGCTLLLRAHQKRDLGFHLSKSSKCLTVRSVVVASSDSHSVQIFSSSHYCGNHNSAAVVFVQNGRVKVAITHHNRVAQDANPDVREVEMRMWIKRHVAVYAVFR